MRPSYIFSPNCREGAAEPGAQPGGGGKVPTVTSLIPWGLPGRWFPCTILLVPILSQPLECTSCRFPLGPICWPHLSWQPVPRVPLPISRNLALPSQAVSSSLSLFSLFLKSCFLPSSSSQMLPSPHSPSYVFFFLLLSKHRNTAETQK